MGSVGNESVHRKLLEKKNTPVGVFFLFTNIPLSRIISGANIKYVAGTIGIKHKYITFIIIRRGAIESYAITIKYKRHGRIIWVVACSNVTNGAVALI